MASRYGIDRYGVEDVQKTLNANARLLKKNKQETLNGNARLVLVERATITGNARLLGTFQETINGNARLLKKNKQETLNGNAKLVFVERATITGNAKLYYVREININSTNYNNKTRYMKWEDSLNDWKIIELELSGVTKQDNNLTIGNSIYVKEGGKTRFYGEVRNRKFNTNNTAKIFAKGYLVKFNDRKNYNTSDSNYTTRWDSTRTDTVMTDLIGNNSSLNSGTLEDNGQDFNIKNQNNKQWKTVKKMIDRGLGDVYITKS